MTNLEKALTRALHAIIRDLLPKGTIDSVRTNIFSVLYPTRHWLFEMRPANSPDLAPSDISLMCSYLEHLEKNEKTTSSCSSITLTAEALAYAGNLESKLLIGLRKDDFKLLGHAWLEIIVDGKMHLINPNDQPVHEFTPIVTEGADGLLLKWTNEQCFPGAYK